MFLFLADNLVVELQADVRVFVPAGLGESVFVKFLQALHLTGYILVDEALADGLVVGLGQTADEYDVVANAWNELDGAVGQHMNLLDEVAPQVVAHDGFAQTAQIGLCEPFVDAP